MEGDNFHKPVLLKEVIEALNVKEGGRYIDTTVGMGGHTKAILKQGGRVLGIDCDLQAIRILKKEFKSKTIKELYLREKQGKRLILERGNFRNLEQIARKNNFLNVNGILFDLGLSSWQIEKSGRGFSYSKDEFLDMRMDANQTLTAADIVNQSTEEELNEIFAKFGEEVNSRAIARAVFSARPLRTTKELVGLLGGDKSQLARIFQALRIAVNEEIINLKLALPQAVELLKRKGRLAIISFHSLEDRVVKFGLRNKNLKILTRKPIRPSDEEIKSNPQARSARLRVAEKR